MGALAFSPDGKKLLWGDKDTTVNLWDLETDAVRTFEGHQAGVLRAWRSIPGAGGSPRRAAMGR